MYICIYSYYNNYNIDIETCFIFNKDTHIILPLMKTTQFQNTLSVKGPNYYNNLLKFKNVYNIYKLKKVLNK